MVIYAEWARLIWFGLLGIDSNDLKIDIAAKREQSVACAYTRMRSPWGC
tara:strand:- start:602 stop:748 length:147 start_codon:yes stop_codon:yes gene_type:complete